MRNWQIVCASLLMLQGCDFFNQVKDKVKGLTNPLVAQGMVLGVQSPEIDGLDLEGSGFAAGTAVTVFLADAAGVSDLEDVPVTGAQVDVEGSALLDTETGAYVLGPGTGPAYSVGSVWEIFTDIDGDLGSALVELPAEPVFSVPSTHAVGESLELDLSGQEFHSALVVVVNVASGEVSYSNEPEDIRGFYDFSHGSSEAELVEIPGTAFPDMGAYAVGVAGMVHTKAADFDGMNTALSSIMAGQMVFQPLATL